MFFIRAAKDANQMTSGIWLSSSLIYKYPKIYKTAFAGFLLVFEKERLICAQPIRAPQRDNKYLHVH